jgi:glycosyltransferase involved in cell wall biosynthesis
MKICFYTDRPFPGIGGAQVVLHHLATALKQRGETVLVLAPRQRNSTIHATPAYPIYRYPGPLSKSVGVRQTLVHLAWLYWRHRFHILHCHSSYPAAYVGATFKRLFGIPMVIRPYGGDDIHPNGKTRRYPQRARRLCTALGAADTLVAQGNFLKGMLLALGVAPQRLCVIHNGVDLATFAAGAPFPHPRPYILGLGKLAWHKGFDLLLRAYAGLQGPAADLLIAGAGPDQAQLEALARQLGIARRVHFLGLVTGQAKVDLMRSALCFVCPSRREAFANVILEALAAGLPVVASAVDGNPELVHHEQHGLLFPAEDVDALTQALRRILTEPALLARLRAAVPGFVSDFDWPLVAGRYLALYHALLQRR